MTDQVTRPETKATRAPSDDRARVPVYRPLTDIIETEDGVSLMLEMPGVGADDVKISLERRVLTIQGTARIFRPDNADPAHLEYGEGDYERAFSLSEDFDPDRIEAELRNGVLTVSLPRAEEKLPKKIAVKTA
jgi:HSP20 family molecular chaperone IbpA